MVQASDIHALEVKIALVPALALVKKTNLVDEKARSYLQKTLTNIIYLKLTDLI